MGLSASSAPPTARPMGFLPRYSPPPASSVYFPSSILSDTSRSRRLAYPCSPTPSCVLVVDTASSPSPYATWNLHTASPHLPIFSHPLPRPTTTSLHDNKHLHNLVYLTALFCAEDIGSDRTRVEDLREGNMFWLQRETHSCCALRYCDFTSECQTSLIRFVRSHGVTTASRLGCHTSPVTDSTRKRPAHSQQPTVFRSTTHLRNVRAYVTTHY